VNNPFHPVRSIPGWGFLRFFLWLTPGFASVGLLAVLRLPGTPLHCPKASLRHLIAGILALVLVACCGYLDSLVTPANHRIRGVSPRQGTVWAGYFALIQILVLPVVFLVFLALAESNGIRV
jgi:hypothetical protein